MNVYFISDLCTIYCVSTDKLLWKDFYFSSPSGPLYFVYLVILTSEKKGVQSMR